MHPDILKQAARPRPAFAALARLTGSDAQALAIVGQMLNDIEADRHPALTSGWQTCVLWAIHALAEDHGMRAICGEKYEYVRVEIHGEGPAYTAITEVACLIELVTDRDLARADGGSRAVGVAGAARSAARTRATPKGEANP